MKTSENMNDLFASAAKQSTKQSFDKTKLRFDKSISSGYTPSLGKKTMLNLKTIGIMSVMSSLLILSIYLLIGGEAKQTKIYKEEKIEFVGTIAVPENFQSIDKLSLLKVKGFEVLKRLSSEIKPFDKNGMGKPDLEYKKEVQPKQIAKADKIQEPRRLLDEYHFPVLTEKEIKENHKHKKDMIKALLKREKSNDLYVYVPSQTFSFYGKKVSAQAFYMSRYEVSNLEYRTFLFDLLIQGEKEKFLTAKPDQKLWLEVMSKGGEAMESQYFSHPSYNDYPVVNVSRSGAQAYCNWLTKETNKVLSEKGKSLINDLRIPQRAEWVCAAKGAKDDRIYPWDGETVLNAEGCYLANIKPGDSLYAADGALLTAKVGTYNDNEFGLYNLCGNVAEMVYDGYGTTQPNKSGTAGGGWMNSPDEVKIEAPDNHPGVMDANPNIGFRVVMTSFSNRRLNED
jgi:formylglycine-generating enzyme required for sulfatase activity